MIATATTAAPSKRRRALRSPGDSRPDERGSSPPRPLGHAGVKPAGGLEASVTGSVGRRMMLVESRSAATVPAPAREVTPLPGPGSIRPAGPTPVLPPTPGAPAPGGGASK